MLDWIRIFIAGCLYYSGLLKLARWWAMRTGRCLVILYECMLWGYEISPQAFELCKTRSNEKLQLADIRGEENAFFDLILVKESFKEKPPVSW